MSNRVNSSNLNGRQELSFTLKTMPHSENNDGTGMN